MNWKVEFDEKYQMVVLAYNGANSAKDIFDSSFSAIELTNKKKAYKILMESQNIITKLNRADVFKLTFELYNKWGMNKSIRIAFLKPKDIEAQQMASFYEISTRNLGWETKIFPERKVALKWLLKDY
ncbi:hypothetical protein [uncultured Eudoraea sp.]|uniref:hypothetical protein n=1 Tax=uncultured Eudoraea sp. TaxID=1035614 RepID=UPI002622CC6C|nr:hypothetical protein [uncultured Eudoraea sp.]